MQKLLEKHTIALVFAILLGMFMGYMDMRSVFVSTNQEVKAVNQVLARFVILAELTRKEQLLRTDEIEWVQEQRRHKK